MPSYYDFKVALEHSDPKVWRRFLLHPEATFQDLHCAIQDSFGWMYAHLWNFTETGRSGRTIANHDVSFDNDFGWSNSAPPADEVPLAAFFEDNQRCIYVYDFGDNWRHEILRYKRRVESEEEFLRRLKGGEQAAPPEDCGGIWGFEEIREIAATPEEGRSEEAQEHLECIGGWDPSFDVEEEKAAFDR